MFDMKGMQLKTEDFDEKVFFVNLYLGERIFGFFSGCGLEPLGSGGVTRLEQNGA